MKYKPDEKDWMSYLYGEMEGEEKERFDQYLLENEDARKEFVQFKQLRHVMSAFEDKEVIAPPIFIGNDGQGGMQKFFWNSFYFKTILGIAASLVIVILVGRFTGTQISVTGNEFKISFGAPATVTPVVQEVKPELTAQQIQQMIDKSLEHNNTAIHASWEKNEAKLAASIRSNLASNSARIDNLLKEASTASQDQVRQYVSSLQTENMQAVKDYFQLTSLQQKEYIESLLVDFAQYLQQQRNSDLQLVQTRLNSIQQNTDQFKQETEQILTSIITTVGSSPGTREIKN